MYTSLAEICPLRASTRLLQGKWFVQVFICLGDFIYFRWLTSIQDAVKVLRLLSEFLVLLADGVSLLVFH